MSNVSSLVLKENLQLLHNTNRISNILLADIKQSSIDVYLADMVFLERARNYTAGIRRYTRISLSDYHEYQQHKYSLIRDGNLILAPQEVAKISASIRLNLPNSYTIKYKIAKTMFNVNLICLDYYLAGADLIFIIKNINTQHEIELRLGDPIGEIQLFSYPQDLKYDFNVEEKIKNSHKSTFGTIDTVLAHNASSLIVDDTGEDITDTTIVEEIETLDIANSINSMINYRITLGEEDE